MTLQTPPYALQSASHGAELFRRALQSLISGTGVIATGGLQVTQNGTPNMSVNVASGQIWIPGTLGGTTSTPANLNAQTAYGLPSSLTSQGSYYAMNDATVNLAIAAANPTNPRIDLVCASIQDAYYSGSTNTAVLQVVTGTAAPSPTPPAAPANTVVLAQVAVAANATQITNANITDERTFVAVTAPSRGNPAGRMYNSNQVVMGSSTTPAQVTSMSQDWVVGGVTFGSNGLTVPITGKYLVTCSISWQNSGSGIGASGELFTLIYKNGASARSFTAYTLSGWFAGCGGSSLINLTAGDTLTLYGGQNTGVNQGTATGSPYTWLDVELVSQ